MKKLLKENLKIIIIIAITSVVATTTTIFAYSLIAGEIGFTPHDNNWDVGDVEAALNDLNIRTKELVSDYTLEEKVIGRWIDGSLVYQRTFEFENELRINSNTWTDTGIPSSNFRKIISAEGMNSTGTYWGEISVNRDNGTYVQILNIRNSPIDIKHLTIRYLK